jgi:hypothetical protein
MEAKAIRRFRQGAQVANGRGSSSLFDSHSQRRTLSKDRSRSYGKRKIFATTRIPIQLGCYYLLST